MRQQQQQVVHPGHAQEAAGVPLKATGALEVDLLLGALASMNVHCLSTKELDQFKKCGNMETINIYNGLTLRNHMPEGMRSIGSGLGEGGSTDGGMVAAAGQCW